jgi:hypothetical protein
MNGDLESVWIQSVICFSVIFYGKPKKCHQKRQSRQPVSNPSEIQTRNLPNINVKLKHYIDLLVAVKRKSCGLNWFGICAVRNLHTIDIVLRVVSQWGVVCVLSALVGVSVRNAARLPTASSRVRLEKPVITQLIKQPSLIYKTLNFTTMFTTARHWSLSWSRWIQHKPMRGKPYF